jgi:hypothetical protein
VRICVYISFHERRMHSFHRGPSFAFLIHRGLCVKSSTKGRRCAAETDRAFQTKLGKGPDARPRPTVIDQGVFQGADTLGRVPPLMARKGMTSAFSFPTRRSGLSPFSTVNCRTQNCTWLTPRTGADTITGR